MSYRVNEFFASVQGEGHLAGTPMVFVRFSKCNMRCAMAAGPKSPGGFDCDTEFEGGYDITLESLIERVKEYAGGSIRWALLTGGEPGLQLDSDLVHGLRKAGMSIAIETNGSIDLDDRVQKGTVKVRGPVGAMDLLQHITVSPKVAEHAVRVKEAHEVRYVRSKDQALPKPRCKAMSQFISPALDAGVLTQENLDWCTRLVMENAGWRLSLQSHALLGVR